MTDPKGDKGFDDIALSDTSDSIQLSPRTERRALVSSSMVGLSSATSPSSPWAPPLPPRVQSSPTVESSSSLNPTQDPASTGEAGSTDGADPTTDSFTSNEPASANDLTSGSTAPLQSYIHPPSQGGSVTWTDHDDIVFKRGKDRGPRVPAPVLPKDYVSKGPLKNFPFDQLRGRNERRVPLTKFQDEYLDKKDQTPTALVNQIVAYYDEIEESKVAYLLEKAVMIQELNGQIRIQEKEINKLKEALAETRAVTTDGTEEDKKMNKHQQELREKEDVIANLRDRLVELGDGHNVAHSSANKDLVETLNSRIHALEQTVRELEEGGEPRRGQFSDPARSEGRIQRLLEDIKGGISENEFTAENLHARNRELERQRDHWQAVAATTAAVETPDPRLAEQSRRIQSLESTSRAQESQIQHLTETLVKERKMNRVNKDRASEVVAPRVKELLQKARDVSNILLECEIRISILQAKKYIDEGEASAGAKIILASKAILRKHLPHLQILHGRMKYVHGKALFNMGLFTEVIQALEDALSRGFDRDCSMADGDCVEPLLAKTRARLQNAVEEDGPA